jgi:hypothetical protein
MKHTERIKKEVTEEMAQAYRVLDIHNTPEWMLEEIFEITEYFKVFDHSATNSMLLAADELRNKYLGSRDFKISHQTKKEFCSKCFTQKSEELVSLFCSRLVFVTRNTELYNYKITYETKKRLGELIADTLKVDYVSLECKVVELYKADKITWADVIESHSKQCEL